MLKEILLLFEYNDWANNKILQWSKFLTEEQLQKEVNFSEGSYIKILAHIFEAHDVWLRRIQKEKVDKFHFLDTSKLSNIELFYHNLKSKTKVFLTHLKQEDLNQIIFYKTTQGGEYKNTIFEILFHIINHSSTHRSQLKLLLKNYGIKTENLDFIFYTRNKYL